MYSVVASLINFQEMNYNKEYPQNPSWNHKQEKREKSGDCLFNLGIYYDYTTGVNVIFDFVDALLQVYYLIQMSQAIVKFPTFFKLWFWVVGIIRLSPSKHDGRTGHF